MWRYAASDSSFGQVFSDGVFHYFIVGVSLLYDGHLRYDVFHEEGTSEGRYKVERRRLELEHGHLLKWDAELYLADGKRPETDKPAVGIIKDHTSWKGMKRTINGRTYGFDGRPDDIQMALTLFKPPLYYPFLLAKADAISHTLFKKRGWLLSIMEEKGRPYRAR